MATIELTSANLEDTIKNSPTLVIDFWAEWCGPCKRFAPIFETVSDAHPDVVFAKLDTEAETEVAGALEIQAIPTLMAFREGILVYREAGAMDAASFTQLVEAVAALDPEELRAQVAQQQAEREA